MKRINFATLFVLMIASARTFADAPATQPAYPQTDAGLELCVRDMLDAASQHDPQALLTLCNALLLPDAQKWFDSTFEADVAKRLLEEYNKDVTSFPRGLAALLLKLENPKSLTVTVTRVENVDDPNAKAFQRLALAAMTDPVPLYTAVIARKGTTGAITLWSLVYVDGRFRLVGKCAAFLQTRPPRRVPDNPRAPPVCNVLSAYLIFPAQVALTAIR